MLESSTALEAVTTVEEEVGLTSEVGPSVERKEFTGVLVSVSSEALRSFPAVATAPLSAMAVGVATDAAGLTIRVSTASTGALTTAVDPTGAFVSSRIASWTPPSAPDGKELAAVADLELALAVDDLVAAMSELDLDRRVTGMVFQ